MLRVDIRDLDRGPVETLGEIRASDPAVAGLGFAFDEPIRVTGQLQKAGEGEFLWRGRIHGVVLGECRRCLTDVKQELDVPADVLFSTDPEAAEDPSVYPVPQNASQVDVSTAVREEVALAISPLVLCREDCAGLCPRCGADLNAGPCECARSAEPV